VMQGFSAAANADWAGSSASKANPAIFITNPF
jgi:hypothetical protein